MRAESNEFGTWSSKIQSNGSSETILYFTSVINCNPVSLDQLQWAPTMVGVGIRNLRSPSTSQLFHTTDSPHADCNRSGTSQPLTWTHLRYNRSQVCRDPERKPLSSDSATLLGSGAISKQSTIQVERTIMNFSMSCGCIRSISSRCGGPACWPAQMGVINDSD